MPTGRTESNQPTDRNPSRGPHRPRNLAALLLIAAFALAPFLSPAAAQGCTENGMNVQCTEFGAIKMPARRDVKGTPVDVSATIILNTGYQDRGARWVMFSVRNVTEDGSSPVSIKLVHFGTSNGDIVTTRIENDKPSEINLWVDTLDLPVGTPISLDLQTGVSQRGAFSLEVLVLAFDRGYAAIKDSSGNDASLFSFTLLAVNKETANVVDVNQGGIRSGKKLPTLGVPAELAALLAVALLLVGRRRK